MLDLNSVMIGSRQPEVLAEFYQKVLVKPADWADDGWYGWQVGNAYFTIGEHSEVAGNAEGPQRVMLNFETQEAIEEFKRIRGLGADVVKGPYEMEGTWIGILADPEGNYFQVMSPRERGKYTRARSERCKKVGGTGKMAQLNPYLTFKGNCREAMEFYKRCLGGKLDMMTHGDSPMAAQAPAELRDKIMHSMLATEKITLMGADMMGATGSGEEGYRHGNTISLCLVCESREEIESLFSRLSQGGRIGNPLKEEFFGTYGDLTDKYGFTWMFQFGGQQA